MRFLMPSRPAIIWAAKDRYGLHEGSGTRNSMRLAFGDVPVIGMRTHAARLRAGDTGVDGSFLPRKEPVVRVHGRVRESEQRGRVSQQPTDVPASDVRQ